MINSLLTFFNNNQGISILIASLSLTVASLSTAYSVKFNNRGEDYQIKRETLSFFLEYSPSTKSRGVASRDKRLRPHFNNKTPIPNNLIIDIQDENLADSGVDTIDDSILRSEIIDLVNYNEMLCLGRQEGVLDKELFDLQFKKIIIADYSVLQNFLSYTKDNKHASYPNWSKTLKDYGITPIGIE